MIKAYAPDLMDRSKIAAAVPAVEHVRRVGDLAGATVAVVDLSRPGVVDAIADLTNGGVRVIGFGSHVDAATLDAAKSAGAEVYARSAFFSRIGEIVT